MWWNCQWMGDWLVIVTFAWTGLLSCASFLTSNRIPQQMTMATRRLALPKQVSCASTDNLYRCWESLWVAVIKTIQTKETEDEEHGHAPHLNVKVCLYRAWEWSQSVRCWGRTGWTREWAGLSSLNHNSPVFPTCTLQHSSTTSITQLFPKEKTHHL